MASLPDAVTRVYRIVSSKYSPFDGSGAYRFGSRWISPGRWVVHAAETYSLAVLENLVHWQTSSPPGTLVVVAAEVPNTIKQERVDPAELQTATPDDYMPYRSIGDAWYERGETGVLWVPSIVSPVESNLLFNQEHADFSSIVVHSPLPAPVDPRLLRANSVQIQ